MKFIESITKTDTNNLPLSSSFQTPKLFKIGSDIGLKIPSLSDEGEITEYELEEINPIIEKLPIACAIMDNNLKIIHINEIGETMFGYKSQELYKKDSFESIFPNTLKDYFFDLLNDLQMGHLASNGRSTFINKSGENILFDWNAIPIHDYLGNFDGVAFLFQNISDEIDNMIILEEQGKILEDIASGKGLSEVLNKIAYFIEKMSSRILSSILVLNSDGRTLRTGAGASLPDQYNRLIYGLEVADHNGSCGTALYRRQIVITTDTSTDPNWEKYKDIAVYFGLLACTSVPIIGSQNQILGTFAFYYRSKTIPTPFELKLSEIFSSIAGIAIEKENTEIKIRENDELYGILTENINDLLFICDLQGRIKYNSASVNSSLGLESNHLKSKNIIDLLYPEDVPEVEKFIKKIALGEERKINCRMIHLPDHSVKWIESWAKLITRKNKEFILIVGHDLTEQKLTEDALRSNERQLKESQLLSNIGSFEWDLKSNRMIWSQQLYKIFGYDSSDIDPTYEWFIANVHPEDAGWMHEAIQMAFREKSSLNLQYRFLKADRSVIHIESKIKIIRNNQKEVIKAFGTSQDITKRKKAEEASFLSEKKYQVAFQYANVGIALVDLNGNFISTNKTLSEILGYPEDEFKIINFQKLLHPEALREFMNKINRMIYGEMNSWIGEVKCMHKKNNYIWGNLSVAILRDEQNKPQYFNIIVQDITEKKNAEENQKTLTKDLIEQNKYLQQVSYITSHNLRSPITNILGLVELFNLNPSVEEEKTIKENLKKAAENLDNIVKDLGTIIDLKRGVSENKQEIKFDEIMSLIKNNFEKQIKESNAVIITNFTKVPVMYSIFSYVLSIISNLFENAIKYRSYKRDLIIKIETSMAGDYICWRICDNGLGLNMEKEGKKLFGMYKRFHTHVQGKGMGLHLVKTQIETLGGKIEVTSKLDHGTCFNVYFKR